MAEKPPLDRFDLDDMVRIGKNIHMRSVFPRSLEDRGRWDRYCAILNQCNEQAVLRDLFESIALKITGQTRGFRPVLPKAFDGPLHAVVWASLDVCIAVHREQLDAGEILSKGHELTNLIHGPPMTTWWWALLKTGAKNKAGTALGGRLSSQARRERSLRWLEIAESRQRHPEPPDRNSRREAHLVATELRKAGEDIPDETIRSALRRLRERDYG